MRYKIINEELLKKSKSEILSIYTSLATVQLRTNLIESKTQPTLIPHVNVHGSDFRYTTHFIDDNYRFLSDYYLKLKNAFKIIPHENIDDENIGYQFPSDSDIDNFIENSLRRFENQEHFKNQIINKNKNVVKGVIQTILENNISMYLLGKVGSGKSTFLKYFEKAIINIEEFKTYLISLSYQKNNDFNIFISKIEATDETMHIATDLTILLQRKYIENMIVFKDKNKYIIEKLDASNALDKILERMNMKDIEEVWFEIENCIENIEDDHIRLLFNLFSDILTEETKIIYSIDGFDILDPSMTGKHRKFIDALIIIQNNPKNFFNTNINIIFISTFRSCTANSCNIPFQNNAEYVYRLAPVSENKLINRAISFISSSYPNTFHSEHEYFFLQLLKCALEAIKEHVVLDKYKENIIRQFDYDYRMLFEYLTQIQYYGVSIYLLQELNKDRVKNKQEVDALMSGLRIFFITKKYYIKDILLLKNMAVYVNPYELKQDVDKNQNKIALTQHVTLDRANHNLKLLNNIYNYMHQGEPKSVFPLLIKYRILQILYYDIPYVSTSFDIMTKIRKMGYRFSTDALGLILEELLLSKFIKIRKINDASDSKHQYAISCRGELVLDLSLRSAYYQHVITYSYVPNNKYKTYIKPYTPNRSETRSALVIGFQNSFIFLLLIREIEKQETLPDEYQIFPTLQKNTMEDSQHIIKGFHKAYTDAPDLNFKDDIDSMKTFFKDLCK